MLNQSDNRIISVNYYPCGYCVNEMKYIIKNPKEKRKKFYAGVFLIKHVKYGYILFDTGYSTKIYKCGIKGKLYNLLNPTVVNEKDTIKERLLKDGIKPEEIRYIILSHLHPDHIGGISSFPSAKIVASASCMKDFKKNYLRSLIFKRLLPKDFESRVYKVRKYPDKDCLFGEFPGFDLFKDKSIFVIPLEGHAKGQTGVYFPEHSLLLAADAAWGREFTGKVDEMSIVARLVQNDYKMYSSRMAKLRLLEENNIRILYSHEKINEKIIVG